MFVFVKKKQRNIISIKGHLYILSDSVADPELWLARFQRFTGDFKKYMGVGVLRKQVEPP